MVPNKHIMIRTIFLDDQKVLMINTDPFIQKAVIKNTWKIHLTQIFSKVYLIKAKLIF